MTCFIPAQAPSFAVAAPKAIKEILKKSPSEYTVEVCRDHRSQALNNLCWELEALQNLRRNHRSELSEGEYQQLAATFLSEVRAWRIFAIQAGNSIERLMSEGA